MISILVVENDQAQLDSLISAAVEGSYGYNFLSAASAQECLDLLQEQDVDLFLIETCLPDQSGLELARQIRTIPGYEFAWIIFLSKDSADETEAFKQIHCYDYLIKPYDPRALLSTISLLSRFEITIRSATEPRYVTFRQRDQVYRLDANDILYIEVVGNNSTIYTYSKIYCLRKMSLKRLKLMLPDYFVQCHKSFIVNSKYIEAMQKGPYGWEINLKNYHRPVPSGDKYKGNVFSFA